MGKNKRGKKDGTGPHKDSNMAKTGHGGKKGEIPMEIYQQIRADLNVTKIVQKKKNEIVGYG